MKRPQGTLPDPEQIVVARVLARRAREHPDRVFAVFDDGSQWTYSDTARHARHMAAVLAQQGVRPGDTVLSWQPNGADALTTWMASNWLGAIYVPMNTSYRGQLLAHVLATSRAKVMVAHPDLVVRLIGMDVAELDVVLTAGPMPTVRLPVPAYALPDLVSNSVTPGPDVYPAQPWDTYAIVYTSGTTGPSKGVVCSYAHLWATASAAFSAAGLEVADRYLVNLPMFHAGGTIGVAGSLLNGASIAVTAGFDTARFWSTIDQTGTTACTLLGAMATFLAKQPVDPADRRHSLHTVFIVPLAGNAAEFSDRFDVAVYTLFNMTEVSCPLISGPGPQPAGICGRLRPGVVGRLVDEHDQPVAHGAIGELVLRTELPWTMMSAYVGMPDATAAAWRNGWFHTGDAFRQDDTGRFFFVDRMKDTVRRRGENISSFEVETAIVTHPSVGEVAVIGVPSDVTEDDVLAVVAPATGTAIDPAELISHCAALLPYFMVPRYIRVVDALPKTPTNKVEKHRLRKQGVTSDTWDRVAAGIEIKRERLEPRR